MRLEQTETGSTNVGGESSTWTSECWANGKLHAELVACPAANRARKERRAYAMAISVFVAISSLSPAGEVQQTGNRKCEEQELQASGASVRGNAEYALDKVHRNVPGDRRLIEFSMGIQSSSTLVDRRLLPLSQS